MRRKRGFVVTFEDQRSQADVALCPDPESLLIPSITRRSTAGQAGVDLRDYIDTYPPPPFVDPRGLMLRWVPPGSPRRFPQTCSAPSTPTGITLLCDDLLTCCSARGQGSRFREGGHVSLVWRG
ncbi:unnamed protein product [Lota lota]